MYLSFSISPYDWYTLLEEISDYIEFHLAGLAICRFRRAWPYWHNRQRAVFATTFISLRSGIYIYDANIQSRYSDAGMDIMLDDWPRLVYYMCARSNYDLDQSQSYTNSPK